MKMPAKPAVPAWLQNFCDLNSLTVEASFVRESDQSTAGWRWKITTVGSPHSAIHFLHSRSQEDIISRCIRWFRL